MRIIDLVHLAGSIASIAGITLLLVQNVTGVDWQIIIFDLPLYLLWAALSVGVVTVVMIALRAGWHRLVKRRDWLWKVAYIGLAGSVAAFAIAGGAIGAAFFVRVVMEIFTL